MPSAMAFSGFLAVATFATLVWGRILWYASERSSFFRASLFFVMGRTYRPPDEIRSLLLSAIYYIFGLTLTILFAASFHFSLSSIAQFRFADFGLVILGIIGEISLANLLVEAACKIARVHTPERFAELGEIPWMKGLRQLPPNVVPLVAAFAGAVEEMFFRGILLGILTARLSATPVSAVAISGALFCLGQLVQVRTAFQALVILSGCVAISLVGGLTVLASGSVVPAVLCHASFVVFFMTQSAQQQQPGIGEGAR